MNSRLRHRPIFVICKLEKPSKVFLILKTVFKKSVFKNFWKISRKLPINKNNFSKVVGEILFKPLSVADTFFKNTLRIQKYVS